MLACSVYVDLNPSERAWRKPRRESSLHRSTNGSRAEAERAREAGNGREASAAANRGGNGTRRGLRRERARRVAESVERDTRCTSRWRSSRALGRRTGGSCRSARRLSGVVMDRRSPGRQDGADSLPTCAVSGAAARFGRPVGGDG